MDLAGELAVRDVREDGQADIAFERLARDGMRAGIDLDFAQMGLGNAVALEVVGAERPGVAARAVDDHERVQGAAAGERERGQSAQRPQQKSNETIHFPAIVADGGRKFKAGEGRGCGEGPEGVEFPSNGNTRKNR